MVVTAAVLVELRELGDVPDTLCLQLGLHWWLLHFADLESWTNFIIIFCMSVSGAIFARCCDAQFLACKTARQFMFLCMSYFWCGNCS